METSVAFGEDLEIPFVGSLSEFRQWAGSEGFPQRGRIDYLSGRIEVDLAPTVRLFEAYWNAGVAEYWLMDARAEELFFHINRRGVAGYEPTPSDSDGFQQSAVLQQSFRLTRRRDRRGDWAFDLERKSA